MKYQCLYVRFTVGGMGSEKLQTYFLFPWVPLQHLERLPGAKKCSCQMGTED